MSNDSGHFPKSVVANPEQTLNTYYLLLEDQVGTLTRKERGVILGEEPAPVLHGSILYEQFPAQAQRGHFVLADQENTSDVTSLNTDISKVARLNSQQLGYLEAIPVLSDRCRVYIDKQWLSEAPAIKVNSTVLVSLQDHQERLGGLVRYKGTLTDLKGIYFGIELSAEHQGKGTTDGVFRRKNYFQCLKDTGVFVAINRVQLCYDPSVFRPSYKTEAGIFKPPVVYTTEKAPLDLGERVVWLSDPGPEYGTVRWVGLLPERFNKTLTVGVELDNPVGSGTGSFRDYQVFSTKRDHASFIPILGLIRASQYRQDPLEGKAIMSGNNTDDRQDIPKTNPRSKQNVDTNDDRSTRFDHRDVLLLHFDKLRDNINIPELLPSLLSHRVLTQDSLKEIYKAKPKAKAAKLINKVLNSDFQTYEKFLLALKEKEVHADLYNLLVQKGPSDESMASGTRSSVNKQVQSGTPGNQQGKVASVEENHTIEQMKCLLKKNRGYYVRKLEVSQDMFQEMYRKSLISFQECSSFPILPENKRNGKVIDVVLKLNDKKFSIFLEVLETYQPDLHRQLSKPAGSKKQVPAQQTGQPTCKTDSTLPCRKDEEKKLDSKVYGQIILELKMELKGDFKSPNIVAESLKKKGVLSDEAAEDVKKFGAKHLLHLLSTRGEAEFTSFLSALQKSGDTDIYNKLIEKLAYVKECPEMAEVQGELSGEDEDVGVKILKEEYKFILNHMVVPSLVAKRLSENGFLTDENYKEILMKEKTDAIRCLMSHLIRSGGQVFAPFVDALHEHNRQMVPHLKKRLDEIMAQDRQTASTQDTPEAEQMNEGANACSSRTDMKYDDIGAKILKDEFQYILKNMVCPSFVAKRLKDEGFLSEESHTCILLEREKDDKIRCLMSHLIRSGGQVFAPFVDALHENNRQMVPHLKKRLDEIMAQDRQIASTQDTPEAEQMNEGANACSSPTGKGPQESIQSKLIEGDIDSIASKIYDPRLLWLQLDKHHILTKDESESVGSTIGGTRMAKAILSFMATKEMDVFQKFLKVAKKQNQSLYNYFNERLNICENSKHADNLVGAGALHSNVQRGSHEGNQHQSSDRGTDGKNHSMPHLDTSRSQQPQGQTGSKRTKLSQGTLTDQTGTEVVQNPIPRKVANKREAERIPFPLDAKALNLEFDIGHMVEVNIGGEPVYGVIRWIGYYGDRHRPIAGIEMDTPTEAGTDGEYMKKRLFFCPPKRAMFMFIDKCKKDSRFDDEPNIQNNLDGSQLPGIQGFKQPIKQYAIKELLGVNKGIQGHHNSCYLDSTLFCMFSFADVFDEILNRPKGKYDVDEYTSVQTVLKERIVNRLRSKFLVPAGQVMLLRDQLDKLSPVQGLRSEEKDPEEFLNCLLNHVMKAEPFVRLSSGEDCYFYQLFVERDESLIMPTTQRLLGLSFMYSGVKFKEKPSVLILQMPRSGSRFKMFKRIICSLTLDITDMLEKGARECCVCGGLATEECAQCYRQFGENKDMCLVPFCRRCSETCHNHPSRHTHRPRQLEMPADLIRYIPHDGKQPESIKRETLELFAVMCIETSHYVSFVKCGTDKGAPWVFFDSMADREGGRNIPEVSVCKGVEHYLSPEGRIEATSQEDKQLPEKIKRLLSDPYLCMYRRPVDEVDDDLYGGPESGTQV